MTENNGTRDFEDIITPQDELQGRIFTLPPYIAEFPNLVQMWDSIVNQLRRDAAGITMNSAQQLLLERIAATYIEIKWREQENTWAGPAHAKDLNARHLAFLAEFNKMLMSNLPGLRDAVILEVMQVLNSNIHIIEDDDQRRKFRSAIASAFTSAGL